LILINISEQLGFFHSHTENYYTGRLSKSRKERSYAQITTTSVNFVEKFSRDVDKPFIFVVLCGEFYGLFEKGRASGVYPI
jgi:hypothetical protein